MTDTAIVGENVEIIQTKGPRPAFAWSVVIAGALAAWAVAFIFTALGAGVGLSVTSAYSGASAGALTIGGAIWMIIVQSLAFATGGYLAARLRIRDHIPGPETKFRDAAHGFMAWVVGASLMAIVLFFAGAFTATTTVDATTSGLSALGAKDSGNEAVGYYVDRLFRTDPRKGSTTTGRAMQPAAPAAAAPPANAAATNQAANNAGGETNGPAPATASSSPQTDRQDSGGLPLAQRDNDRQRSEVIRILSAGIGNKMSDTDNEYLAQLVAARTGMTQAEAEHRVTEVENQATERFKQTAEAARKAGAYLSFWSFMALLFGAVAATLAGILGGELRDEV